jgi:signal recognition particle subunit SRP14
MPESQRLSPADFLSSLATLLNAQSTARHGSIFLVQKPLFPATDSESTSTPSTEPTSPAPQIIIRATNGLPPPKRNSSKSSKVAKGSAKKTDATKKEDRIKLSTVVAAEEIEDFFAKYAEVCKAGMVGLRKRDRKKAKKANKGKKGPVAGKA